VDSAGRPVVVDTNIFFSALLNHPSRFSEVLLEPENVFVICESTIVELFSKKERIMRFTRLDPSQMDDILHILLCRVNLSKEDDIPEEHRVRAWEFCKEVDPADTPQVALTLALDGLLWTGDRRLRRGLEARGFDRFFTPDE
jgi:predicted nucleic acid-binding protein